MTEDRRGDSPSSGTQWFSTTRWSLVLAAGDARNPLSREALASLCKIYWPPVYAYVRRRGHDPESARDLTQGFFTNFLESGSFGRADPARGRFRSYLLGAVNHYLANEWDRTRSLKRGGGEVAISLDLESAEARRLEPAHDLTPEKIFERRWALALLEHVLARLWQEKEASRNPERFERLMPLLTGGGADASYRQLAADLGMTEAAVKVAVHRLRRRYGELLREEVAQTVRDPSEVDEELRYLLSVLGS